MKNDALIAKLFRIACGDDKLTVTDCAMIAARLQHFETGENPITRIDTDDIAQLAMYFGNRESTGFEKRMGKLFQDKVKFVPKCQWCGGRENDKGKITSVTIHEECYEGILNGEGIV